MTKPDPETPLDAAHAAMQAAPADRQDSLRLAFHACLAESELFLLLQAEAQGDSLSPRLFPLQDGPVVLVFDTEARLAAFAEGAAPYAALPGRVLLRMLADAGADAPGLGVNLGVAPSATLLPAEAVRWLADTLTQTPAETRVRPEALHPPDGRLAALLPALDARLSRATGLAAEAWLAGATLPGGGRGHLLVFVDAAPGAEPALARGANAALLALDDADAALDVAFVPVGHPLLARLAPVGLRIDLARPDPPPRPAPRAPGTDPDRPPRLRRPGDRA